MTVRIQVSQPHCPDSDLRGADLVAGAFLAFANFADVDLLRAGLSGANQTGATLAAATLIWLHI